MRIISLRFNNARRLIKLFLIIEVRHLLVSAIAGAIGLLAYDVYAGAVFFIMFFLIMQPFVIGEFLRRK